jgi:hypothetical protein
VGAGAKVLVVASWRRWRDETRLGGDARLGATDHARLATVAFDDLLWSRPQPTVALGFEGHRRGGPVRTPRHDGRALAALDAANEWWRGLLSSVTEVALAELVGPVAGQYAESTKAGFVLHQLDEMIHHGAEVAVIRDLYAATVVDQTTDASVESLLRGEIPEHPARLRRERPDLLRWAAANGYWQAVPVLVDLGSEVNAVRGGATALHHAAAAGELAVARGLVEGSADLSLLDDQFQATPLCWAEFFGRQRLVDYLRSVAP